MFRAGRARVLTGFQCWYAAASAQSRWCAAACAAHQRGVRGRARGGPRRPPRAASRAPQRPHAGPPRVQSKRLLRASTIHGLAGMAAIMASTYKAHFGEGLGPLSWITKFRVPHPGRVGGYFAMNLTMPTMLGWVLGGNTSNLARSARAPVCHLGDKPKAFAEEDFRTFLRDDAALLRAANARWLLVPAATAEATAAEQSAALDAAAAARNGRVHVHGLRIALPECASEIGPGGLVVGRGADAHVKAEHPEVRPGRVLSLQHGAERGRCAQSAWLSAGFAEVGKQAVVVVQGSPQSRWPPFACGLTLYAPGPPLQHARLLSRTTVVPGQWRLWGTRAPSLPVQV